jgi:phage terminase large subunit
VSQLIVDVPEPLVPLAINPARYKAAYGGRGGAKSHFFAEQIVIRCYARKTRVACIREIQASLRESVRQLLIDKIEKLGLGAEFDVRVDEIRCKRTGSLIIFRGMQSYNAANIKSLEGFNIAWVEEAQTFSEDSLRMLRPTLREEGSEIWFSWNPRHDTDPVDKFFRGANPPHNSIAIEVNWYDNPWFPEVLRDEKDTDYANDPEVAEHVWGGGYERITEGAYYAKHIAAAEKSGRVGYFPHVPEEPVFTGWDLGVDDYTAVWFFQVFGGLRVRVIDYYEASGIGADEILAEALPEYDKDPMGMAASLVELGRDHPFKYQRHFMPHDIGMREWGAGAKTRAQTLVGLGVPLGSIHRGVAQNPEERINASRRLLPMTEFHQSKRVMLGLSRLRRYSRRKNEALGTYLGPLHDVNSHGADAYGEFAINCGIYPPPPEPEPKRKALPGQVLLPGPPEPPSGVRIRI